MRTNRTTEYNTEDRTKKNWINLSAQIPFSDKMSILLYHSTYQMAFSLLYHKKSGREIWRKARVKCKRKKNLFPFCLMMMMNGKRWANRFFFFWCVRRGNITNNLSEKWMGYNTFESGTLFIESETGRLFLHHQLGLPLLLYIYIPRRYFLFN